MKLYDRIVKKLILWLGKSRLRCVAFGLLSIIVGIASFPFWFAHICSAFTMACVFLGLFAIWVAIQMETDEGEKISSE